MNHQRPDYQIEFVSGKDQVAASVPEVRLLYMIDGTGSLNTEDSTFLMSQRDIAIINSMETAVLEQEQDAVAAVISLDYLAMCDMLGTGTLRFYLNVQQEKRSQYDQMREQVRELLMTHLRHEPAGKFLEWGCCYKLIYLLLSAFLDTNTQMRENAGDLRVARMLAYIHAYYGSEISLIEIAGQLYLSSSSASRLFQKATGKKYAEYLRQFRLEQVKRALLESDQSITRIALNCGFSTPSVLNKVFRQEFGITPSEYREQNSAAGEAKRQIQSGQRQKIYHLLEEQQRKETQKIQLNKELYADVGQVHPHKRWENRLMNIGPVHLLTSASMQKQILFLANQLNVEYLRVWNLFSPKMMIGSAGTYNFTFLDEVLDFCVDNRLDLFIDLSQRRDMALASESREIYSTNEQTIFPSRQAWAETLEAFLHHIRKRYHERVVGKWIFEFTFFLNDRPYYSDEQYTSMEVWETGFGLVKKHIPSAKVAGPGLVSTDAEEKTEELVKYLLSSRYTPDIFTMMSFPYAVKGSIVQGGIYQGSYQKVASRYILRKQMEKARSALSRLGFEGQLWITEWGGSLANRNFIQDSCFRGAYTVDNVLDCHEEVETMGIFYASDLLNAFSDSNTLLCGSAGLLSRNGICKPVFYAYQFLDKLGRYRINQNDCCIVTSENIHDIRILCFNNKAPGPKYFLLKEDESRPHELRHLFLNDDPIYLELTLQFPEETGTYTIRQKILNEKKGSILDKWIDFGCSASLSRSDMEYLERISTPEITMEQMRSANGKLRLSVLLEPHELRLITIMKE